MHPEPATGHRRRAPEAVPLDDPCLGPGDHACIVADDRDLRLRALACFAAAGFARGERVLVALPEGHRRALEEVLAAAEVDVASVRSAEDLVFLAPERVLPSPPFHITAMADRLDARIRKARRGRPAGVRVGLDMGWARRAGASVEAVVEFERTVNQCVLPGRRAAALCTYPEEEYGASALDGVVGAHPLVLAGGRAAPNPLFGLEDAGWVGGGPGAWTRLRWVLPWLERAADIRRPASNGRPGRPDGGEVADSGSRSRLATRACILVVDDDPDSAGVLLDLLEAWGHRAELAADGVEALEKADRVSPDLIFLDLGLPKLDGLEVARRIRQRRPDGHRPVLVAMTGWGRPEDRERTREVGFDHHVVKPISIERIRKLLEPSA